MIRFQTGPRVCARCRWLRQSTNGRQVYCVRFPPKVTYVQQQAQIGSAYPVVSVDATCQHFHSRAGWFGDDGPVATLPTHINVPAQKIDAKLSRYGDFLRQIFPSGSVDFIHAVDVISALPAQAMHEGSDALFCVDVNEFPILSHRIGRQFTELTPSERGELESDIRDALSRTDWGISYSAGVGRLARFRYGLHCTPLLNLQNHAEFKPQDRLREAFEIPPDHKVIVHPCTYAPAYGSDDLPSLLAHLPDNYHLVMVGAPMRAEYDDQLKMMAAELGVAHRLHLMHYIASKGAYLAALNSADLGLVYLARSTPNARFGFSNRFADLLAARVPIISTNIVETNRLITGHNIGKVVRGTGPEAMAEGILNWFALPDANRAAQRWNIARLSETMTWDSQVKIFLDELRQQARARGKDGPLRCCILFPRGLVKNKRVLRVAEALAADGHRVVVVVGTLPPQTQLDAFPNVRAVKVPFGRIATPGEIDEARTQVACILSLDPKPICPP